MKHNIYNKIDICPVNRYIHASSDLRNLLVLDDYSFSTNETDKEIETWIKNNTELYQLLDKTFYKLTMELSKTNDVPDFQEIHRLNMLHAYIRMLYYLYYLDGEWQYNIDLLKIMKQNNLNGNFKKDTAKVNVLGNRIRELDVDIHRSKKTNTDLKKQNEHFKETYYTNLLTISRFLGHSIDYDKFTLLDYKISIEQMKKQQMHDDSNKKHK